MDWSRNYVPILLDFGVFLSCTNYTYTPSTFEAIAEIRNTVLVFAVRANVLTMFISLYENTFKINGTFVNKREGNHALSSCTIKKSDFATEMLAEVSEEISKF